MTGILALIVIVLLLTMLLSHSLGNGPALP
jgi:hypothetical protein